MLKEAQCARCGKRGCERCLMTFGHSTSPRGDAVPQRACSQACFDQWVGAMVVDGFGPVPWGQSWTIHGTIIDPPFAGRAHQLAEQHRGNLQIRHAANLLEAERFEDAAKIYDSLGMWKEAGDARRRAKRTVVTQVQVDVNSLIDQVRKGGLTTTYSCPACHSPIQISAETDVRSLKHCQYCGSVIQSTDLVEFLSRVVGYR
jgi:DNA-directed RNA polymerase subunit RPC12/RpoP